MNDSQRVYEAKIVGRDVFRKGRVVHDEPRAVVSQEQTEHILANQLW